MEKSSLLYIAYHYPPVLGSSGVHRTLAFTRHLAEHGWQVRVLTVSLKAYDKWSPEQLSFIPKNIKVVRGFARNVAKHFSLKGKYWGGMSLPDNWQSWIVGGVISGLISIIKERPNVMVSTYPIASAHFIAYLLHKITGVPWVADLRDPMAQSNYPANQTKKKWFQWIERKMVKHCDKVMITCPGAQILYQERFPETSKDFWQIVPNGYDKVIFDGLDASEQQISAVDKPLTVLHSGLIYPYERDPSHFFAALSELKKEGVLSARDIIFKLRATGHDGIHRSKLIHYGVEDLVSLEPTVPYKDALKEMMAVDGLLLLQAANCNYQIPAKAYEYIRAQKPVLALTPIEGDTGQLLDKAGNSYIAALDDQQAIKTAIINFYQTLQSGEVQLLNSDELDSYSRQSQAYKLEETLNTVVSSQKTRN
ncbi:glycosyltransferase family 4 protein [Thalassotalea sp. M1531]|uniref:Glycosyltransferase family 4 protein n=1 Tax=Thalassotalea algicola TaxID=2716224 RepID=A0A7Y0LGZ7_9GAMM|nr:glycosyltransferase [Thalassotalea algicola]NMP33055.1 glycosyltransferase family 4 protein [Thalassotalea algicola]